MKWSELELPWQAALGNRLYTNGELQGMCTSLITTAEMIDRMSHMIN